MTNIITGAVGLFLVVVMVGSGSFVPNKYLEPWDINYAIKFTDPRIQVSARALLAPNGHNMQPWKIKLDKVDPQVFYLYGDAQRLTPEIDPPARQFTITQGTFLEYLRVAAEQQGDQAKVTLFPAGEYDDQGSAASIIVKPVAKIELIKSPPVNDPRFAALFLPDTNRAPYQPTGLTAAEQAMIASLNNEQDLSLKIFQNQADCQVLKALALRGMEIETNVHQINILNQNLTRVNEYQKNNYRDGFSLDSQGSTGLMLHVMQSLLTIAPGLNSEQAARELILKNTRAALENTPAYVMILTRDNSRTNQVKAGMLYSRLLLTAQAAGLVLQPLSQSLEEYPEMQAVYRRIYHQYANDGAIIQMLVRIGRPTQSAPRSMRRDIRSLLQ